MRTGCRCAAVILPLLLGACSDPTAPLAGLELQHGSGEVVLTQHITITVKASDTRGRIAQPPRLQWSADDPSIATVDQAGVVTGQSVGSTRIRAAGAGLEASLEIRVLPALLNIRTETGSVVLVAGEKAVISAQVMFDGGVSVPGGGNAVIRWSTPDTDVVQIQPGASATAEVTAVGTGLARIFADFGGVRGSIVFAVPSVAPGESPFRVTAFTFVTFYGFAPSLQVNVVPGHSVELVRLELALPGADPSFPLLCSSERLLPGTHDILGTDNSPVGFSRNLPDWNVAGLAVVTYRVDDGPIVTTAFTGGMTAWDYDYIYVGRVPWEICAA